MIIYYLFIALFAMAPSSASVGIADDLTGHWKGTITQKEGGYRPSYRMEMILRQEGKKIVGQSFVYADDIYAAMELKGEFKSGMLMTFEEIRIVDCIKNNQLEWCIKKGQLIFSKNGKTAKLEGFWQGESLLGTCVPGEIFLQKAPKPRT